MLSKTSQAHMSHLHYSLPDFSELTSDTASENTASENTGLFNFTRIQRIPVDKLTFAEGQITLTHDIEGRQIELTISFDNFVNLTRTEICPI